MKRWIGVLVLIWAWTVSMSAQKRFFNLSAEQVGIDSVLPQFVCSFPLTGHYEDSVYTVKLVYPEFMDMSPADVFAYRRLSSDSLPKLPVVTRQISVERKRGTLIVSFCPLVFRNGKYQLLVSFMVDVEAQPLRKATKRQARAEVLSPASRYVSHSVLSNGTWAKIRVPSTGVYQLTDALVKKAGFSNLSKVKVYGYGGNLQDDSLNPDELVTYDDLKEVPQCWTGGKHLFYAKGPVSWDSNTASKRTRNPYSDEGYYFITQTDDTVSTVDSSAFVSAFYPSPDDYHSLYEVDGYSWYHGGRNLFDSQSVSVGNSQKVVLTNAGGASSGRLSVCVSAGTASQVNVTFNGTVLGALSITLSDYDEGNSTARVYDVSSLGISDTVVITPTSGGPVRLDYVSMAWATPRTAPDLKAVTATPEYVEKVSNQDLHADSAADMIIIIPTSKLLLTQAKRLAAFHESHDSLRVRILPANELYNEFSSGTPDANAYRRYLKMLYDRAASDADLPKYLLLFGDCVWDNRMLTSDCKNLSPDDYLLCFESENSFNEVSCYVDDSWMGILGDNMGGSPTTQQIDVAVGRFPVTTADDAKIMVDKTINYVTNSNAGAWQNTLMFMGDDGNANLHMEDENEVADYISGLYPGYLMKKVMWDAYTRETSSTGNTYPQVSKLIKQQQANGALIMDYAGHGSEIQISHEAVLRITDFAAFTNQNLPLWITASCDIMPFDGTTATIGETAVLNENGGAVAFYGTTRTVYANLNKYMNRAFLRRVLEKDDAGKPRPIGEAHRLAQNDLIKGTYGESDRSANRLQYSLLGDPAMALNLPVAKIVVDSINGVSTTAVQDTTVLKAGSIATVKGHIENAGDFRGVITTTVRDSKETITCKNNDGTASEPFQYTDRTKTLFSGSDSIKDGQFAFSFAVPKDIQYSNGTGLMNLYAVNRSHTLEAHGYSEDFVVGGSDVVNRDSVGPSLYCYLNSSSFSDGGKVNTTPYFYARISDADGINVTGNGVGHDLELIIDGDMEKTYVLNDYFSFDFGSYTSGYAAYSIPELDEGSHTLLFRAWDVLNNSSTTTLNFQVVKGLEPNLFSVGCTDNPATTTTTFIINHDRTGSDMDVEIDVFDMSGRQLWNYTESGVPTSSAYTVTWDLTVDGGRKLQTGVYLYRVKVSSDGSQSVSKARKLIVIGNNS